MYDPEAPYLLSNQYGTMEQSLGSSNSQVGQPEVQAWKTVQEELKSLIVNHYQQFREPIRAEDIYTKLFKYTTVAVQIDYELLVILLDNLGGFIKKKY